MQEISLHKCSPCINKPELSEVESIIRVIDWLFENRRQDTMQIFDPKITCLHLFKHQHHTLPAAP